MGEGGGGQEEGGEKEGLRNVWRIAKTAPLLCLTASSTEQGEPATMEKEKGVWGRKKRSNSKMTRPSPSSFFLLMGSQADQCQEARKRKKGSLKRRGGGRHTKELGKVRP